MKHFQDFEYSTVIQKMMTNLHHRKIGKSERLGNTVISINEEKLKKKKDGGARRGRKWCIAIASSDDDAMSTLFMYRLWVVSSTSTVYHMEVGR